MLVSAANHSAPKRKSITAKRFFIWLRLISELLRGCPLLCFFLVVYALAVVLKVGIIFPNSLKRTFCVFRIASFSIFDIQKRFL